MRRWRKISIPIFLAATFGVAAELKWEDLCGCISAQWSLAYELHYSVSTPEELVAQFRLLFASRHVDLAEIRALGDITNSSCAADGASDIRCTYWLWTNGRRDRGLELVVTPGPQLGIASATSKYVEREAVKKQALTLAP